ncbi:hypothetical protein RclHR1_05760005 [Rhizophagus clarus]|uniref:Uncharacterized protein n=1 Tax=Rhizophagus clarus TaxID=94130 RepID=A0A2Z6SG94_9GLOM|nr:hypothetical protein RclHR1_05760005 [Rhizophagus clarus]
MSVKRQWKYQMVKVRIVFNTFVKTRIPLQRIGSLVPWEVNVKTALIAFFETYDDLKMALETRFHLDGKDYCWTRPQPIQPKKKNGKNSLAQELKKATEDRSSSVKRSSHNAKDPK